MSQQNNVHQKVAHCIPPVYNTDSRILILGTMPSNKSREIGFYYMHATNRFWTVMEKLFDANFVHKNNATDRAAAIAERKEFALKNKIALWDVLSECEIIGQSDSSIKNAQPNDISQITDHANITAVFCTGTKSHELYKKFFSEKYPDLPCFCLPSTSAANAHHNLDSLVENYKAIKETLERG